jgi:hypothetical protein
MKMTILRELNVRNYRSALAIVCVNVLLLSACTTTTTQSFNVSKNANVEAARIAADADFSKYNELIADDMGIFFPKDATPSEGDQEKLRQIFREAFLAELSEYTIVEQSGPQVMRVQATLVDFRGATYADLPLVRRELRDIAKPGALLFLMEFKDSESDRILARAADSAAAPKLATSAGETTDWISVETAAKHWAGLFRQFLDNNLGQ